MRIWTLKAFPLGLMGYPVLQTADILMPKAHFVPVGKDNEAHIELARDIAADLINIMERVFPLPEDFMAKSLPWSAPMAKGK